MIWAVWLGLGFGEASREGGERCWCLCWRWWLWSLKRRGGEKDTHGADNLARVVDDGDGFLESRHFGANLRAGVSKIKRG